ncbi:MAG: hypothetical protein OIF47_16605 [Marinibacterium sp.]|nr:hypothetical protein [Marinibacterium sp.]
MDGYSRFVSFLRVALPLAALGLLSSLFLLARGVETTPDIPFAESEITDRTREQTITAPVYAGVTRKGEEIMVTAETSSPGIDGGPASAETLSGRMILKDNSEITLVSDDGSFDLQDQRASFIGNVVIESTLGYRMETALLHSAMDRIEATAPGRVDGTGPIGELTAGRMEITSDPETDNIHLFFNDGVHLIYDPKHNER